MIFNVIPVRLQIRTRIQSMIKPAQPVSYFLVFVEIVAVQPAQNEDDCTN
jgi:hypothetical protein